MHKLSLRAGRLFGAAVALLLCLFGFALVAHAQAAPAPDVGALVDALAAKDWHVAIAGALGLLVFLRRFADRSHFFHQPLGVAVLAVLLAAAGAAIPALDAHASWRACGVTAGVAALSAILALVSSGPAAQTALALLLAGVSLAGCAHAGRGAPFDPTPRKTDSGISRGASLFMAVALFLGMGVLSGCAHTPTIPPRVVNCTEAIAYIVKDLAVDTVTLAGDFAGGTIGIVNVVPLVSQAPPAFDQLKADIALAKTACAKPAPVAASKAVPNGRQAISAEQAARALAGGAELVIQGTP